MKQSSRNIYKEFCEISSVGFVHHEMIYDSNGQAIDYKFLDANKAYENITGLKLKSILGKTVREILPNITDDPFNWIEQFNSVVTNKKKITLEQYSEPLKKRFNLEAHAYNENEFVVFLYDHSDKFSTKEANEEFFELNPDLLCIADQNGNFIKVNHAWEVLLGYSKTFLESSKFLDFIHPDDITATINEMSILKEGRITFRFTNRYRCKDGTYKHIEWHSRPKGDLIYAAARDVSDVVNRENRAKTDHDFISYVTEIATSYINLPLDDIKVNIQDSLKKIGQFAYADRAFIFKYDWERNICINTYEWTKKSISKSIAALQEVGIGELDDLPEKHKSSKPYHIKDVSKLPNKSKLKSHLIEQNIQCVATFPIYHTQKCIGFVGIEKVQSKEFFSDQEIQLLYLYANVLTNLYHRSLVENKLIEERNKLQHVLDSTGAGTWEWDVRTDILTINNVWASLIGYELNELSSHTFDSYANVTFTTWKSLVHPIDLANALKDINLHLLGRISQYNVNFRMKHKAGHWVWINSLGRITEFNEQGKGIRMYGIHIDLTQSKEKEIAIQESETKYRILADHTFHWEFWISPTGKHIYHSKSCEIFTGFSPSKFLSNQEFLFDCLHPEDLEKYKEHQKEALSNTKKINGQKNHAPYILRFKHKNGEYKLFQHVCKPVFDESGSFLGVRGTNIDITEQEKLKERVLLSEEKYRSLFNESPLPLYVFSNDNFRILNVNKAAEILFGYSKEELLNMTALDLRDKNEVKRLTEKLQRENSEEYSYFGVWRYLTKEGKTIIADKHSKLIDYEGAPARLTMIHDITEQFHLQKEIEENKNLLSSIFENSGTLIYMKDTDGRYTMINRLWEETTEIERARVLGKTDWELFDEETATQFVNNDQEVLLTGISKETEEILSKNGLSRYFITIKFPIKNAENEIVGICGISTEITDRKYSEEAIRKLSRAVEQSPASIVITDTLGNIEYVNKKFSDVTGYSFKEAIYKNPRILKSGDKTQQEYEELWNTILNGQEWKGEFQNRKKDGSLYWESATISAIKDEHGIITHFLAVKEDITNKKENEKLLRESEETFRKLYEDTRDAILLMRDFKIVSCNHAAVEMMEASSKEVILGSTPKDISPEKQPDGSISEDVAKEYIQEALEKGYKRFEWLSTTLKGNLIYQEVTLMPITLKGEELLHVTWRDISERKEAELRIIKSESRYRLLAENASDVIWILNLSKNKFTYISPSIYELRGLTVEEALAEKMEDSMTPESLKHVQERTAANIMEFISQKGQNDFHEINEIQQPCKDGRIIWVEVSTRFSFNEEGDIEVVGVSRNIEERKKVELERVAYANSIKESKEQLEELAENSRTVVWEIDLTGTFKYVSKVASKVYGYEPEEIIGKKTIFDLHPEKGKQAFIDKIMSFQHQTELGINVENPIETKSGKIIWVNSNALPVKDELGDIIGYRGTDVDITERKEAEIAIEEKNKQLNLVIDNIPGAVFNAKNDQNFTLNFISPFIENITGYKPVEINREKTISFIDLVHHDDLPKRVKAMQDAYNERRKYTCSYKMLNKRGNFHWVYEIGEFKFEEEASFHEISIDGILFDITEKIAAEEEKVTAVLAATDEERSRIAHELHEGLQQTLVAAKMNLELLQKEIYLLSPGTQSNFDKGLELIRDGIKETRSISHSLVPKQVKEVGLVAAIENLTVNIGKKINCNYYYQNDLEILNDAMALNLYRIVQESVTNVLKHAKATKLFINLIKENNFLILTIEDNGLGFDVESLNKSGKGIGLLAMKNRATAIGATMDISSEIGKGTLISIEVPISEKAEA